MNLEETEIGANALGVAIRGGAGEVVAGLSVSIPPARFRQMFEAGRSSAVFAARERIEAGLEDFVAGQ